MSDPIGFYAKTQKAEDLSRKDFPKKSKLALQMESKGGILAERVASSSVLGHVPILGKISVLFAERSVKREYIQEFRGTFTKNASENGLSTEEANDLYDRHVKPVLAETDLKDIASLETFTNRKAGVLLFVSAYKSVRPDLRVQEIRQNILRSMRALQTESTSVERLCGLYLNTEEIFEELAPDTTYHLLDTGMRDVEETTENRKRGIETTLDRYEEFITAAKPLKQPLKTTTPQQRGNIIKLALTKTGHLQIMGAIQSNSSNPSQMLNAINHLVATNASQNALNLDAAIALMPRTSKAMGNMSEDQQMVYIQAWVRNAEDLNQSQFDKFLQRFKEHLILMETLKAEVPRHVKVQIMTNSSKAMEDQFPTQTRRLNFVMRGMMEAI